MLLGKIGPLAQLVEHRTFNPGVEGSIPSRLTKLGETVARSSSGLGHKIFNLGTGVRFSYGLPWAISSAGRAPALQAGGRRFKPCIAHHGKEARSCRLVV